MGARSILRRLLAQLAAPTAGAPPAQAGAGPPDERPWDFVEVFAGDQAVSKGLRLVGYTGKSLDLRISETHNVLSATGFLVLLAATMKIREGGLLWAAPPCSTWVFLSRGSTGRNVALGGNPNSPYVQGQNALVKRLILIWRLCVARRVFFVIEQPKSSCMFDYEPMKRFLESCEGVQRVQLQMGAFGMAACKDTWLVGVAPWLGRLARRLSPAERSALREEDAMQVTRTYTDATGARRCQGAKDLKATQSYPMSLGAAHALAFRDHDTAPTPAAAGAGSSTGPWTPAPPAAAGAGGSRAGAWTPGPAAPGAGLDFLLSVCDDDEDEWYVADLQHWGSQAFHDNSGGEHRLALLPGAAVKRQRKS